MAPVLSKNQYQKIVMGLAVGAFNAAAALRQYPGANLADFDATMMLIRSYIQASDYSKVRDLFEEAADQLNALGLFTADGLARPIIKNCISLLNIGRQNAVDNWKAARAGGQVVYGPGDENLPSMFQDPSTLEGVSSSSDSDSELDQIDERNSQHMMMSDGTVRTARQTTPMLVSRSGFRASPLQYEYVTAEEVPANLPEFTRPDDAPPLYDAPPSYEESMNSNHEVIDSNI